MEAARPASCPNCGEAMDVTTLMANPDVVPIGMQIEDTDQRYNYYYFNHVCEHCGTTFLLPVQAFLPFITEPVPDLAITGTKECEGHCLDRNDHEICGQTCLYAPFRRHLQKMKQEHETALQQRKPAA